MTRYISFIRIEYLLDFLQEIQNRNSQKDNYSSYSFYSKFYIYTDKNLNETILAYDKDELEQYFAITPSLGMEESRFVSVAKEFMASEMDDEPNHKTKTKLTDYYKKIDLAYSSILNIDNDNPPNILVFPKQNDKEYIKKLTYQLAELDSGLRIKLITVRKNDKNEELALFKLEPTDANIWEIPYGLIGNPILLKSVNKKLYLPLQYEQGLLNNYAFLIPPESSEDTISIYLPVSDGKPQYTEFTQLSEKLITEDTKLPIPKESIASSSNDGKILMSIRQSSIYKNPDNISKVIYHFRTSNGDITHAFLNVLSLVDAKIEDFIYYSKSNSEEPYAPIDHYLLLDDARLLKPRFNPNLIPSCLCYVLPKIHEKNDLPVFLPYGKDFAPSLYGLLENQDKDFIPKLKSTIIGKNQRPDYVLLDSDWNITNLRNGKKLSELIAQTLKCNVKSVSEVNGAVTRKLDELSHESDKQLLNIAETQTQEFDLEVNKLSEQLNAMANAINNELSKFCEKICDYNELMLQYDLKFEQYPSYFLEFISHFSELIESVTEPRHEWFSNTEEQAKIQQKLLDETKTLQQNANVLLENISNNSKKQVQELESVNKKLESQEKLALSDFEKLKKINLNLESNNKRIQEKISEIKSELDARYELNKRVENDYINSMKELENQKQELLELTSKLDKLAQEIEITTKIQSEQKTKLNERQKTLNDSKRKLENELKDLTNIKTVLIPSLENDISNVSSNIDKLKQLNLSSILAKKQIEYETLLKNQEKLNDDQKQIKTFEQNIASGNEIAYNKILTLTAQIKLKLLKYNQILSASEFQKSENLTIKKIDNLISKTDELNHNAEYISKYGNSKQLDNKLSELKNKNSELQQNIKNAKKAINSQKSFIQRIRGLFNK